MSSKSTGSPLVVFEANTNKHIAMTMEIAEGVFGGDPMWVFFRRTLLRRLNDIKREGITALAECASSNTTPVGVAIDSPITHSLRSQLCEKLI